MFKVYRLTKIGALIASAFALSACGGGSNNETTLPDSGVAPDTTWTAGNFSPASTFKDYCDSPRTGNDPYNSNQPYPDKLGAADHEKMWLRSWTNETYLWYDEVPDNNPVNFTVSEFFKQLKTTQLTDSGAAKDQFHFAQNTADYKKETQAGVVSGYGIEWSAIARSAPRDFKVAFTEPNSPAANAGIERGFKLTYVNGVDFINDNTQAGVNTINAALFPSGTGETHQFTFLNRANQTVTVNLTSADLESSPVQNIKILDSAQGKVGYVQFNAHIAKAQDGLISAVKQFSDANVSDLVVDLRYNGGGLLALASQFAYMVAGDNATASRTFEQTVFNDKTTPSAPTPFYSKQIDYSASVLTNTNLPSLSLNRVFVLTTSQTCSASEAFINGLQGIDVEVIQIGGQTCGKPYGFYPTDNCATTYFSIQFSGVNAKGFGDYADGFKPSLAPQYDDQIKGCDLSDDFSKVLGDPSERLLNGALTYINTGSCPVNKTQMRSAPKPSYTHNKEDVFDIRYQSFLLENKINAQPIKQEQ
ncbi:hypothetical protein PULV_a3320 [Pseudoalteromonas ulvae UL12]|uniref:S41 family peptidase n=1 Tax=Pseudoalteromonas ulvae TaxID=107327 RepID=UPI00186B6F9F|nr:S41 family peptidase [Pseudoalteromonas ulvae]MBE0365017.1 hypothetical protein [Pseudoalteromonas ulvae UL12]